MGGSSSKSSDYLEAVKLFTVEEKATISEIFESIAGKQMLFVKVEFEVKNKDKREGLYSLACFALSSHDFTIIFLVSACFTLDAVSNLYEIIKVITHG